MYNVPNAEPSPRIVNGVMKWYEFDTFDIQFDLNFKDQDGEKVIIGENDTVIFEFLNCCRDVVKVFTFTNIQNNTVKLDFDADTTALFPAGNYTYDAYYDGAERITLANNNKVVVEK